MKKTGIKYLVDTNIIIDFFGGDNDVKVKLSTQEATIPSVVVGELYYGAFVSSKTEVRLQQVKEFIDNYEVIHIDENTARYYGQVKAQLKKAGTPIPENDIWIAALSMQHTLFIATRDHHFDKTEGIQVAYW